MTIRGIAARPERNSQCLWISVSCGVSVLDGNELDAEVEARLAAQVSCVDGT
jgi:hypothetical protein